MTVDLSVVASVKTCDSPCDYNLMRSIEDGERRELE